RQQSFVPYVVRSMEKNNKTRRLSVVLKYLFVPFQFSRGGELPKAEKVRELKREGLECRST
ncbi:MAG: hypothetical protein ACP5US_12350, partial [Candidatus Kryptoniota bacterium]